jgi:SagB-type dehydrogenase family enzyme
VGPKETALAYHQRTKHSPHRYARALGYLDWDTQPDPFRRYEGAPLVRLRQMPPGPAPLWEDVLQGRVAPALVDAAWVSQLFYDSMALSAWKEHGRARWSLRVNPSSGNLHPTESYIIAGALPGLADRPGVYHYSPSLHALEERVALRPSEWQSLAAQLPRDAVLVALTSIYWRESWKYGERAYRYCHHDTGHAIGAVALAAAVLGAEVRLLETATTPALAALLGVNRQAGAEAEHADCLLAVFPRGAAFPTAAQRAFRLPPPLLARLDGADFQGDPNRLSTDHHAWPIIDAVSEACRLPEPPPDDHWTESRPRAAALPPRSRPVSAREIIRRRRSAVDMDGRTSLSCEDFFRMLAATVPAAGRVPFEALPWRPRVHLLLFVHRVRDLSAGLYLLLRDTAAREPLRAALPGAFAWSRPPACPEGLDLWLLQAGDCRSVARAVSCGQEIAADGAFAVAMLAELAPSLADLGAWMYPRLHWETGCVGQILYLEAEAAGVRATGIGCFFDDLVHELLGLSGADWQSLYHFTVGGAVDDPRLRTVAPYADG